MQVLTTGIPRAMGDRQECESTNELATLLTTAESKIQDKHRSITHVFKYIYREKR